MATFLLSVLIFGSAGAIVYTRLKSGKNCDDCQTACPVKKGTDQAMISRCKSLFSPFLLILLEHSKMRESKKRKRKENVWKEKNRPPALSADCC